MGFFTKTDEQYPDLLRMEASGLRWLAQAMCRGGAHVVPVVSEEPGRLTLTHLPTGQVTAGAARAFGRALALTHAAGAASFGCGPPGWEAGGNWGRFLQPLRPITIDNPGSFGSWFASDRLECLLPPARDNGSIDSRGLQTLQSAIRRIEAGEFDAPQPALVTGSVARIHGDLWCGNVLWVDRDTLSTWAPPAAGLGVPDPKQATQIPHVVGVLIDPLAHGGHAETDLAHLGVFGQPHLELIYAGYQEISPLAPQWQERVGIFELNLILLHAALFGGHYGGQAVSLAQRYA